jgi:uncharacterized protein DUF4124
MKLRDMYQFERVNSYPFALLCYSQRSRPGANDETKMAKTAGITLNLILLLAGSAVLLSATPAAHADTYRWVDDSGVVNYAERIPRDVPAERVSKIDSTDAPRTSTRTPARASTRAATPATPGSSSVGDNNSQVPLNANQKEVMRDLEAAEAQRQQQVAKIREDNCLRARRVLTNLSAKSRIRVRGEDGQERAIGEDERQQRIADAQRGIAENCDS